MAVEKIILGKLPVSRGNWDALTIYYKYNIVTCGGSSFMSVWDGDPFSGNLLKPGVVLIDGVYYVTINGVPQTAHSRYWQLLAYGVNVPEIVAGYTEADNQVKSLLIGNDGDAPDSNTIKGVKHYADLILGDNEDTINDLTIYGIRKRIDNRTIIIEGPPVQIPESVGQLCIDTINKVGYLAVGTTTASDWKLITNG